MRCLARCCFAALSRCSASPVCQTMMIDDFPWLRSDPGRRCFNIGKDHGISERDFVEFRSTRKSFFQGFSNFVHSLLSLD